MNHSLKSDSQVVAVRDAVPVLKGRRYEVETVYADGRIKLKSFTGCYTPEVFGIA